MEIKQIRANAVIKTAIANSQALKRYLQSLEHPVSATPEAWFYEELTTPEIVELFAEEVESKLDYQPEEYSEVIAKDKASALEKLGSQGGHPGPEQLNPLWKAAYEPPLQVEAEIFSSPLWKAAKLAIAQQLPKAGLKPLTVEAALTYVKTDGTIDSNGGMPTFANRRLLSVQNQAVASVRDGTWRFYPAIALYRTYRGKTRLVWMFPFSTNLQEARFAVPLQKAVRNMLKGDLKVATTPWSGQPAVQELVSDKYENAYTVLAASDFSATDASFRESLTAEVFDVFKVMFDPSHHDELWESLQHMHHIPLVVNSEQYVTGEHGVASGSFWTNLIETLFDIIFTKFVELYQRKYGITIDKESIRRNALRQGIDLTGYRFKKETVYRLLFAIGDDIAWQSEHYDDRFAFLLSELAKFFGLIVKAEKTTNEPDTVKTLQRRYYRGVSVDDSTLLRANYPFERALNSIKNPERRFDPRLSSLDQLFLRTISIADNCSSNLGFREFAKFVLAGNPGFALYAAGIRHVSIDVLESFLANPFRSGISYTKALALSQRRKAELHESGKSSFLSDSPTYQVWTEIASEFLKEIAEK